MKTLKYILLTTIAVFTLASCDQYLDQDPYQEILEERALNSDRGVKMVLLGAYSTMNDQNFYGGLVQTMSELLAGDGEIQFVGTYNGLRQIFAKSTLISSNENARATWLKAYELINICNNVLSAVDIVLPADRGRVEGEARFLRAAAYFELIRLYGNRPYIAGNTSNNEPEWGVPLVLTPTRIISDANKVPRATIQEVYDQIIVDLKEAAAKLPSTNGYFATKGAAQAMLARVYLQMQDYPNARDYADTVIQSNKYSLVPVYANVFNQNEKTTEDIFVNKFTTQTRFSAMTEYWSIPDYGGRDGDIDILNGHLNLYPAGDARRALFFHDNIAWRSGKWNNQYGTVVTIRLAEMYLIRAECNQRLGTSVGDTPLNDINRLCARAGLGDTFYATITLDDILLQRRLELAHEGHKLHDIKRLQLPVGPRPYDHPKLTLPIPEREIQAYLPVILKQNDGY
ncbi:MAG TPA: RagB/SusD family nutrient uptake outer membrane protein [Salinivirgaceae bacterium]|nr:RagB/SusD family nutrient uptake outer membrane protein [Salinivirgaceae bacterium]